MSYFDKLIVMDPNLPQQPITALPSVEPPTQTTQPAVPASSKSKFPIFLIVALLFIILGLGGFFGYQKYIGNKNVTATPSESPVPTGTRDPTANWKIYTNSKYGYSLKYPSSSTTVANGCEGINGKKGEEWFQIQTDVTNPSIQAECRIVSVNPGWWVFVQNGKYINTLGNDYAVEKQTTMLVGGYSATRYYYRMNPPKEGFDERWQDVTHTVVKHPTKDIFFVFELNLPEKEQFFDQILSTFRFIDPSEASAKGDKFTDETVSWKEYKTESLGLSFKAPTEMNVDFTGSVITIQNYPLNAPPPDKYYKALITITEGKVGTTETVPATKENKAVTEAIVATFKFEE